MSSARAERKAKRTAAARSKAGEAAAVAPGAILELQQEESDDTVAQIARILRKRGPDLGDEANPAYLAASFVAYAGERRPRLAAQWQGVLAAVLEDASASLDDDDNAAAVGAAVQEMIIKRVLSVPVPKIVVGDVVLALLTEDEDWHEAAVEEALPGDVFRVMFLEYHKPQDTPLANLRAMDTVVDEGSEDAVQEGDCEMCRRHLLLTFHHLIPKDTHSTYLKKRLPPGIEGEPSRGFLNSYGIMVCRQCHSCVHRIASNEELAKEYNTLQKVLDHPGIQRWIDWVAKQRGGGRGQKT